MGPGNRMYVTWGFPECWVAASLQTITIRSVIWVRFNLALADRSVTIVVMVFRLSAEHRRSGRSRQGLMQRRR
jgi:hypothetical protein